MSNTDIPTINSSILADPFTKCREFLYAMPINLHPATVHFPIAFLLLASVAGLLYLYWQPLEVLRTLTWWPLRLGWLGAGIAILTGIFAQSGLPPQAPYRAILNWHISTGLAVWVLYGLALYRHWLYGKATRKSMRKGQKQGTANQVSAAVPDRELLNAPQARLWLTVLFVIGSALVLASGWNGGRLVYVWGVNVVGP